MRVDISHHFVGGTLQLVEDLYMLDEPFNEQAFATLGYERQVVGKEQRGTALRRRLHLRPLSALPAPFSSLVRGASFHIIEEVEYDFALHRGTWTTTPSVLAKQFQAAGVLRIEPVAGGVTFRLDGAVRSGIPLLGRSAEKQAVKTAEEQHAALARAVRARLEARQPQAAQLRPS